MKILELRFKNLNSLYGEWIVDFSHPEYSSNGIFALTGPTGAGKSTILDAVCLALYGATPRLGKITKSSNEIMSRRTGECYAEVLFESQAGRFRCHWEQRRARKKAEGKLQDQEHQIADADTGKLIETKKSRVGAVIEAKTGMDFERFTRSILLAQGGFDTFLKANIEQKSKILEQITGTEIYSQISSRVHERQREEREKLNMLNAETSGMMILQPEEEKEIQDNLGIKQAQEPKLVSQSTQIGEAINWLITTNNLQKEISLLEDEAAQLNADNKAFQPQRIKLEQALKTESLAGIYAALIAHRQQQSTDKKTLNAAETALPKLESSASTQAEALQSAEQLTRNSKKNLTEAAPLIQKTRLLDQKIAEQKKAVAEGTAACTKEATKIKAGKQSQSKEQKKLATAEQTMQAAERYLRDNARDEWLISGLTGIEAQLANLLTLQQEIRQKETDIENADTAVANTIEQQKKVSRQYDLKKQALQSASENLRQGKTTLSELLGDKLLREYRTEQETLLREMAFIRKIEELETHRSKLEDGKPCPLCGAVEHPFAEGNIPPPDDIEQKITALSQLISKAENQQAVIKKLQQAESTASKNLSDSEKREITAANDRKVAEKTHAELQANFTKLQTDFMALKQAVSEKLQPLGITEIPETEVEGLLDALKSRLKAWQKQVKQKATVEAQVSTIDNEIKRLDAVIEMQANALNDRKENLQRLKQQLSDETDARKQLYGDKNPDKEEIQLNQLIADAEKAEKKANHLNTELQQQLTSARTQIESLKKRIEQRVPELEKAEADFFAKLFPVGFADEKSFLEARLSDKTREALSSRVNELDKAKIELTAKQKDRKARFTTELDKNLTNESLEALQTQLKELEASLKQLQDAIATLKHQLRENTATKARIKEKQSAIDAQKKECHRWEKLHGLIGSADGKKYRNFAQGLTFELMVTHANRQLAKMTDRYLLIRDKHQPLELNVVDNYQAGEIRSTKNLSGGESFIVSLTLALGLSKMASRKVRVDSLFLDEGFGTLDEDALETALETLSGLQHDGKLIGIISHVTALKERIGTQINITPVSGGRSALSGPGCTKLVQ